MPRQHSRRVHPDGVLDPDRGSSSVATVKQAQTVSPETYQVRAEERDGARELDAVVEGMPGLSRQQRDRERAMPRDLTGAVPHPRMERRLPAAGEVRRPLSSRQRKARSVTKRAVADRLPETQHRAVRDLLERPQRWQQLNDALSDAAGDVQGLDDPLRITVQRVDRVVQAYERANDRGHLVYCNVALPPGISRGTLAGDVRANFRPGTVVHFDRFTAGAHSPHEIETGHANAGRAAIFEIETRRGAYFGRSDSADDTAHLLPRGLRLRVAGTHLANYTRPDGSAGHRHVIQLHDIT